MAKEKTKAEEVLEESGLDSSEYAQKKSIFSVYKGLFVKITIGLFSFILLLIGLVLLYQFITRPKVPKEVKPDDTVPASTEPPAPDQVSIFGYIKDKASIWTIDINGKNRKNLLELSNFNQGESYTALTWKLAKDLTYSYCSQNKAKSFCRLYTYNLDSKSQTLEQNLDKYVNVPSIAWSPDNKYLAFIAETEKSTGYYFRSGTVVTLFASFVRVPDESRTKAKVFFTEDNQYVVYYSIKKEIIENPKRRGDPPKELVYPYVQIFRVNGVKVDEFVDVTDPFIIDNETIAYKKKGAIFYKKIGQKDETLITNEGGFNPILSPNKENIAFWNNESSDQKRVVLQIFDTKLNIRRDILRGIILPIWLTDSRLAGIKADNCLSDECLLFEFQTAGLVVVDVQTGQVFIIDQGASITNVMFNELISKPKPAEPQQEESPQNPQG